MENNTYPAVDIVVATRNGEKYVSSQLKSLIGQTYKNIRIIIHDDGSTDNTVEIIKRFARENNEKVTYINDGRTFGSAQGNFFHLMRETSADYVAFCDQDDVWTDNHVEVLLQAVVTAEAVHGDKRPIGSFGDLTVVDRDLNIIVSSFWRAFRINKEMANDMRSIAVRNVCTGCCMLINRAAIEIVLGLDLKYAVMHDHFISLSILKSGNGVMIPVDESLVLYRQHGVNTVGASLPSWKTKFRKIIFFRKTIDRMNLYYRQSKYLGVHQSVSAFIFDKIYYKIYPDCAGTRQLAGKACGKGADGY